MALSEPFGDFPLLWVLLSEASPVLQISHLSPQHWPPPSLPYFDLFTSDIYLLLHFFYCYIALPSINCELQGSPWEPS